MNLATLTELFAGGDGSGCHGPNCGRPSTGAKAQQVSGLKWLRMTPAQREAYYREHTQTGQEQPRAGAPTRVIDPKVGKQIPHSGKAFTKQSDERTGKITGPQGAKPAQRKETLQAPIYKKSFDKPEEKKEAARAKELQEWKGRLPQPRERSFDNRIQDGTIVKTKEPMKAFNNDTLEFQKYKPGTPLIVQAVLPKVGTNPTMLTVQFPHGDIVHVPAEQVAFFRPGPKALNEKEQQELRNVRQEMGLEKGVRPGRIVQQSTTSTGATYTVIKPQKAGRPTGSGNIYKAPTEWKGGQPNPDEHPLKGKFEIATGSRGQKLQDIFTFSLNLQNFGVGTAKANVYDANYKPRTPDQMKEGTHGSTVIVWRDPATKTGKVMEYDKDNNGYIKQGSAPAISFRNIGHLGAYLKQRYDISMKLPSSGKKSKGR